MLTHDVESQQGLARVKKLAAVEIELGFRSSFNFVPEGVYDVPPALRNWLTDRQFEIAVHDLHHDGRLYASFDAFRRKAERINQYLKEWNAVGFRSAFMLHKLDWLHELQVQYDASTFDTDPFEPQPDGVETIFPFWVPKTSEAPSPNSQPTTFNHSGGGYVELPYTLPQDSTLFLMLKEPDTRTWRKKLDWIADRGGMALLNVHPDFLAFSGGSLGAIRYPASWYAEFLSWVKRRYLGDYWHAKPAAVAKFVRSLESQKRNFGGASSCSSSRAGAYLPAGGLDEDCIYCRR